MTTSLLGGSKISKKDLDLVILTSDALLQTIKLTIHSLFHLIPQFLNPTAVKASPLVHATDSVLLFVVFVVDIIVATLHDTLLLLEAFDSFEECIYPIVQVGVCLDCVPLQILITPLVGFDLIGKTAPYIMEHLQSPVGTIHIGVDLLETSIYQSSLTSLLFTHIGSASVHYTEDLTGQGCSQSHGLDALIVSIVLIPPANGPHPHEVEQDPISEDSRVMSMKFFGNANGITPEVVIKVTLPKDVLGLAFLIKLLFPWESCPMNHMH